MNSNSRFSELTTEEIQEIMDKAVPQATKKPQSSGWGYLTVRICQVSLKIFKISNVTFEILHIYDDYITTTTTTMFTLMLQNGLLVLVAPHFKNQ